MTTGTTGTTAARTNPNTVLNMFYSSVLTSLSGLAVIPMTALLKALEPSLKDNHVFIGTMLLTALVVSSCIPLKTKVSKLAVRQFLNLVTGCAVGLAALTTDSPWKVVAVIVASIAIATYATYLAER